jgi:hypothetical protein
MAKNYTYRLIGATYPTFIPVAPNTKKTSSYREWGRSPKPGVISIGLPRAPQVLSIADRESESYRQRRNEIARAINLRSDEQSDSYPRMVNEFRKEEI